MKPIIVIQDDFSLAWSAVSSMKGVIKSIDRSLEIEDGTHEIEPFNIWMAAEELQTVELCWPKGTIFVSVVDPGVGTSRRACVAKLKDGSYVVTPDNGTLTLVKETIGIEEIREIDETINRNQRNEKVAVFDGRDVFAFTAARLAAGIITFEEVGPLYPVEEVVLCPEIFSKPILWDGHGEGFVNYGLSYFGGIRASITNDQFKNECGFKLGEKIHTVITYHDQVLFDEVIPFVKSFGYVKDGEPLVYQGSSLFISLDLNKDNFMHKYDVHAGIDYKITFDRVSE